MSEFASAHEQLLRQDAPSVSCGSAACVAGMAAHNRRIAAAWPIGDSAAPVKKWRVNSQAADLVLSVLRRDWSDGTLRLYDPLDRTKVKAKLHGFSMYDVTQGPHDPALQALDTLIFESESTRNNLRLYLPGFSVIEHAVLQHASQWCSSWFSNLISLCICALVFSCRVLQGAFTFS